MRQVEILLIEDNEDDAELAIRALLKNNIVRHIEHIKDGPAAVDFLFKKDSAKELIGLKLILLDLNIPKFNGLELLKKIKQNAETRKIPVILLTSSKEDKDVEQAYQLGVNSYVVKPIESDKYIEAMQTICHYWITINQSVLAQ